MFYVAFAGPEGSPPPGPAFTSPSFWTADPGARLSRTLVWQSPSFRIVRAIVHLPRSQGVGLQETVQWIEPWQPIDTPSEADALRVELSRELPPAHPLSGLPIRAIARRRDDDDVLFAIEDGSGRVASVHLTWRAARRGPAMAQHDSVAKTSSAWARAAPGSRGLSWR